MVLKNANSAYPDEMPHFAASHLGLQCLHMSHYGDVRRILFMGKIRIRSILGSDQTSQI